MATMSNEANPTNTAKRILLRLGLYFGLLWLIQSIFDHGQVPFRVLAVMVVAMASLSFMVDVLLPPQADRVGDQTPFDRKSLRQALHIAIGGAAGFTMGHYYRNHDTYSVGGWVVCIAIYLIGGFIGGYG